MQVIVVNQRALLIALPILMLILGALLIIGHIFAPLIIYSLAKKRGYENVMSQAIDASDFAINITLYAFGAVIILAILEASEDLFTISLGVIVLFYLYVLAKALIYGAKNRETKYPLFFHIARNIKANVDKYAP